MKISNKLLFGKELKVSAIRDSNEENFSRRFSHFSRLHYLSKYNHKIDLTKNQLHNPQSRKTAILIPHAESVFSEKKRARESE